MTRAAVVAAVAAAAVSAVALACLACSGEAAKPGHDAGPPVLGNRATEQSNGSCPGTPSVLLGTKPPASTCASASDCKPVCCDCDAGARHWLAAACDRATSACADEAATCSSTKSAEVCP